MVPKPRAAAAPALDLERAAAAEVTPTDPGAPEKILDLGGQVLNASTPANICIPTRSLEYGRWLGSATFQERVREGGVEGGGRLVGRFNAALLLCCFPAFWSAVSVTSAVSYIFTSAQCDKSFYRLDTCTVPGACPAEAGAGEVRVEGKEAADFESAMAACGVGRFNAALLLCCFPAFWSAVSVTSAVSYIFTSAQCDKSFYRLDTCTVPGACPAEAGAGEARVEGKEAADFESAMAACGVGRFNAALLLCCFPAFWSAVSVTSAVSYIFTSAQCDMSLSLLDMGTVNAITYAGMISSAMVWGYLSDTLGRRSIMVWGFLMAGLVELLAAVSQNFAMLLVTRFFAGFLFNGPFAVLLTYVAELHVASLRARVLLYSCLFYTLASSTLPLLAWAVLPRRWDFTLFGGAFAIRPWNVFLVAAGAAPLLSAAAVSRLPESPKFLMSRGRNLEALQVFRYIYSVNSRLPPHTYPVTELKEERSTEAGRGVAALRGGIRQLAPLFRGSNLLWLLLMCTIHAGAMFGSNTLRLWFPQLAAMLEAAPGRGLCESVEAASAAAVSASAAAAAAAPPDCATLVPGAATYLQSVVVGAGSVLTYGIGGLLVNACGKRRVAGACALGCALLSGALPAASAGGAAAAVTLVASFLALTSLAGAALSSIMVDLFPTTLRAMAVATFLMAGRLGTIAGNVAFPALLRLGCLPPFATIGAVMTVCGLACLLVPDTTLRKLQ